MIHDPLISGLSGSKKALELEKEAAQLMETRAQFAQKAERYLETAIFYIKAHRDDYPNYFLHAPNDPADGIIHRGNTNRKTFLA